MNSRCGLHRQYTACNISNNFLEKKVCKDFIIFNIIHLVILCCILSVFLLFLYLSHPQRFSGIFQGAWRAMNMLEDW